MDVFSSIGYFSRKRSNSISLNQTRETYINLVVYKWMNQTEAKQRAFGVFYTSQIHPFSNSLIHKDLNKIILKNAILSLIWFVYVLLTEKNAKRLR